MKSRLILLSILSILLAVNTSAQGVKGNGILKTDIHEYTGFKHIILHGNFTAILGQSEKEGVRINADENIVTLFQTRMDKEILYITMRADIKKFEKLEVRISFKELISITLLDQVELKTEQVIHFEDIAIFSSDLSRIDCEIFATTLNLELQDNTFTKLKGYSQHLDVSIHDETELNAFGLQCEKCDITSTGFSEVMVNCIKSMKLKVTGESNVYYTGEPRITERIFSSAGFIVKRKAPTDSN